MVNLSVYISNHEKYVFEKKWIGEDMLWSFSSQQFLADYYIIKHK